MLKQVVWALAAAASFASFARPEKVVFPAGNQKNYERRTRIAVGAEAGEGNDFVVTCTKTSRCETAWQIVSDRLRVPSGSAGWAYEFEIRTDADWSTPGTSDSWGNAVTWYDGKGDRLAKTPIDVAFHKSADFVRFRFSGATPPKAAAATVEMGVDNPNLPPGEKVTVRKAVFTVLSRGAAIPPPIVHDVTSPLVYSRFSAPSPDRNLVAKYEIVDDGEIDWGTLAVTNAETKAAIPFVRDGNVVTLRPETPWAEGVNTLVIAVADGSGNATRSHKAFLIGPRPETPRMSLRDDGVALVDGKPFFPIGLYGVTPHEFNDFNMDKAVADLKAAGFNFLHSYTNGRKDDFMEAVAKHGLLSWTYAFWAHHGDKWLVEKSRTDRTVLAWYTGDDTSRYVKPTELLDRHEATHMLDGNRLSCQADVTGGDRIKSLYQDYVTFSDVFLPELYHVYNENPAGDIGCVAYVIRDMEKAKDDIARHNDGRPRALWPILQFFDGNLWHRFPSVAELYGMSFAALIHGGNGITWFHYAGEKDLSRKRRYSGVFRTPEDWAAMTNLTARIAALTPVLLERTPKQPAVPEVLEGDRTDKCGQPSVSVLVKEHGGSAYVFAVNSSPKRVKAKIFASVPDGEGSVAWEKRRVKAVRGAFEDEFDGYGVHVYRFGL